MKEAALLTRQEYGHIAAVAADFFIASYFVFSDTSNFLKGVLPGVASFGLMKLLATARVVIIDKQRQKTAAFAGRALHFHLQILAFHVFMVIRYACACVASAHMMFARKSSTHWSGTVLADSHLSPPSFLQILVL